MRCAATAWGSSSTSCPITWVSRRAATPGGPTCWSTGPLSPYARYFDIDWNPVKRELAGKVLLPILGDQYGAVLERGELKLELVDGIFRVRHYETILPVAPRSYTRLLGHRLDELQAALGPEHPACSS